MNKVQLDTFNNSWYQPGPKWKIALWYVLNLLIIYNPICASSRLKIFFLRLFGASIGKGVTIKPFVRIKYPWNLHVGDHTWIGESVWIDNLTLISIGDNVCISQGAMLLCGNHNYRKSSFDLIIGEIHIENGSWIGAKSVVCPGVSCGSHSVLSVGSIATRNLDPYSIYQGNPAIKIRSRTIT